MKKYMRTLWQLQPVWLRKLEISIALVFFAKKPLNPSRFMHKGDIVVCGFLGTACGVGESARQILQQFENMGLPAYGANASVVFPNLQNNDPRPLWPVEAQKSGIVLLHVNADTLPFVSFFIGRKKLENRRCIGYWYWETPFLSRQWHQAIKRVDEIWVATHYMADIFKKAAGNKSVYVIPPPLDVLSKPTAPREDPLPQFSGRTIVLFMYDVGSSHTRKNPEAVIAAFQKAANGDPSPVLVIKINNSSSYPQFEERLRNRARGYPNIHFITERLSSDRMNDLMARIDIVISLHRAEGFGLLMAEGMAAAKPVIATNWSGNVDFMTPECGVLIDYKLVPVIDEQGLYVNDGKSLWAEPDIDQAAAALRRLLADPHERQRLGQAARQHIENYFSPRRWKKMLPDSLWQTLPNQEKSLK